MKAVTAYRFNITTQKLGTLRRLSPSWHKHYVVVGPHIYTFKFLSYIIALQHDAKRSLRGMRDESETRINLKSQLNLS
jgi:predicted phosphatase